MSTLPDIPFTRAFSVNCHIVNGPVYVHLLLYCASHTLQPTFPAYIRLFIQSLLVYSIAELPQLLTVCANAFITAVLCYDDILSPRPLPLPALSTSIAKGSEILYSLQADTIKLASSTASVVSTAWVTI